MAERVEASSKLKEWRRRGDRLSATPDIVPGVPVDLSHSVDEYGSLVTVAPADWLIGFVPGLQKQWWHKFVKGNHKHVFAMRPLENGSWLLVESWWTRLMVTILPPYDAAKFLRWGATGDIVQIREEVPGQGNQVRGWANCAVLAAFVLGRRSRPWTPHGLYLELVKAGAKHADVETLLVDHFKSIVGPTAAETLRLNAGLMHGSLEEVLFELGRNILASITSQTILKICFTAVIEAERYPRASEVYHEQGLLPVIDALAGILTQANERGETDIADCRLAASQFIAMLRGDLHLAAMLDISPSPTAAEIDARARSVVRLFLRGARPRPRRQIAA